MDNWVRQVLHGWSVFDAFVVLYFPIVLDLLSEVFAPDDALSADFETMVHLAHGELGAVEAVHAATRAFKVHHIELFVEKCIETQLSGL